MDATLPKNQFENGPGFESLLETTDFSTWSQVLRQSIGHHQSQLLSPAGSFQARLSQCRIEEFTLPTLHGCGQMQLDREQVGEALLWLPMQGWSHEIINGEEMLAESGMGMVFQPGDAMSGKTSERVSGISIRMPPTYSGQNLNHSRLLNQGRAAQAVIQAAFQLAAAAAQNAPGTRFAAQTLQDALAAWRCDLQLSIKKTRLSDQKRRETVADASEWMNAHLGERFGVEELSKILQVSKRTLQICFQQELGRTPMQQAKRLRMRRLRQLLLDQNQEQYTISELMQSTGLLACGATARDYQQWCGELPSQTRRNAN